MELKKVTEKHFPVTFTKLYEMLQYVIDYAESLGFDKNWRYKIELVVEEALVNVIKYSGQTAQDTLSISLSPAETLGIVIAIKDKGIAYNPLSREIKDVNKNIPLEERPIGGFGVHLIREFMDKVEYQRENDTNVLILTKFLQKKSGVRSQKSEWRRDHEPSHHRHPAPCPAPRAQRPSISETRMTIKTKAWMRTTHHTSLITYH